MAAWLLPALLGAGASLLGNIASGRSNAKTQQANIASQQGQSELAAYAAAQNAKAQQAEDIATRPEQRVGQGALGDLVTQYQTPTVDWGGAGSIPKVSGGWSGLSFSPSTRESASLMQKDALLRQMQGQSASDITTVGQVPNVSQNYPKSSLLDTIIGYAGTGLNGLAAYYALGGGKGNGQDDWLNHNLYGGSGR